MIVPRRIVPLSFNTCQTVIGLISCPLVRETTSSRLVVAVMLRFCCLHETECALSVVIWCFGLMGELFKNG